MTHDDPKLTAYALNELDEADRAEVEAFLAENEAARRFVEETRRTVAMLTERLRAVQVPALTLVQKHEIAVATSAPVKLGNATPKRRRPMVWARFALAAAACAAVASAGIWRFSSLHNSKPNPGVAIDQTRPSNVLPAPTIRTSVNMLDWWIANPVSGFTLQGEGANQPNYTFGDYEGATGSEQLKFGVQLGQQQGGHHFEDHTLGGYAFGEDRVISGDFDSTMTGAKIGGGNITRPLSLSGTTHETFQDGYGSLRGAKFSQIDALQNSIGFTSRPSTGVPGSIGATGSGTSGGYLAEPTLQLSAGTTATDAGTENGYEVRRIKSGNTLALAGSTGNGGGGGGGGGRGGSGGAGAPYGDRFTNSDNSTIQNGTAQGQPAFFADANHGTTGQQLSRGDLSALVAHYRLRGADGYHLLDGGVVGYTQAQFEDDVKTGNFPPQVITAMRQAERTAAAPNESYAAINDNPFLAVAEAPLSTFSIDVDTGSYSNIRRFLNDGHFPPPDAVRIEEMLNYFPYQYETPKSDSKEPFAATVEIAGCPWNSAHRLARVAIKGREIAHDKRPVSNLVFLIDVSGSMNEPAKLPLVKDGLKLMVNELTENDRISIVVYAGTSGLVLPSTTADPKHKEAILEAIDKLSAGGSTNGGQGIELAYKIATDNFIKGGTNRVLLATDGDWNVGITDQTSLMKLIQDEAKSGVFLSVLGYGFGNLKDSTMEKLADKGNGHYAYIDGIKEAKKVLIEEMSSTLVTIAKDVKIQVEFNPLKVESYRLIGYEKRLLRKEDFNNDKVDAGEIGAGHCVTALYEIAPIGADAKGKAAPATQPQQAEVDSLKYQKHEIVQSDDLMTLKMRYKQPDGDKSTKLEFPAVDKGFSYSKASEDFKFSAAVAQFGMILRSSPHKGTATLDGVLELADEGKGKDEKGYRTEFLDLVKKARALSK